MDLFGIGPFEFLLILLIALIVLGPQEMANNARKLAGFVRKITRSPTWRQMMSTSREIRDLPTRLVRESGFQEQMDEIRRDTNLQIDKGTGFKPVSHPLPGELTPAVNPAGSSAELPPAEVPAAGQAAAPGSMIEEDQVTRQEPDPGQDPPAAGENPTDQVP